MPSFHNKPDRLSIYLLLIFVIRIRFKQVFILIIPPPSLKAILFSGKSVSCNVNTGAENPLEHNTTDTETLIWYWHRITTDYQLHRAESYLCRR